MEKKQAASYSVVGNNKSFGKIVPKVKIDTKSPPSFKPKKIKIFITEKLVIENPLELNLLFEEWL